MSGGAEFVFTTVDLFLGIVFGAGLLTFTLALYFEAKEHAPFYTILMGLGTMLSFIATFVAAMKH